MLRSVQAKTRSNFHDRVSGVHSHRISPGEVIGAGGNEDVAPAPSQNAARRIAGYL
jgi:hypothetical protein